MNCRLTGTAILAAVAILPFHAHAALGLGTLSVNAVAGSSGSYQVTATVTAFGTPIASGINLLRVDGATPVILGAMHDDGLNGDAVAGDGIYTWQFTAASVSQMQLQASAAFRTVLRRPKSAVQSAPIVTPSLTLVSPNSGRQGQTGLPVAITGQNTNFSGSSTASFGPGITVTSLVIDSATSATAILTITGSATIGTANVTMTSGLEVATLANGFSVTSPNLPGDVVTWHYDNKRSGVQSDETILTPANVNSSSFGKLAEYTLDGQVDGQVLYLHQVNIPNVGLKNVVYVATENDSVYAIDAATLSGSSATVLWKTPVLADGETAVQQYTPAGSKQPTLGCGNIFPSGITATPVIDRTLNAIYVVSMSQDSTGKVYHRLHALDLGTGLEVLGGPTTIQATYPGSGGNVQGGEVIFGPVSYPLTTMHERAALLETGGSIFTTWSGMYGDCNPYEPFIIAYSASSLATQTAVIDLAPNFSGGGMWMSGGGPSVDAAGNIYTITGNGFGGSGANTGGTPPASYNNSMVKMSFSGSMLSVADYFTPWNTGTENEGDQDFGSVAPMLFDATDNGATVHHLVAAGGKDGQFYVVDQDHMGGYNSGQTNNKNVYQTFALAPTENFSSAVYFNGTVYVCPQELKAFTVSNAMLVTPPTQNSSIGLAVISISANGANGGIVWAVLSGTGGLWAFNASTLATLYNSVSPVPATFSSVVGHFITPAVVDGNVYFGTGTSLVVFGLLK